MSTDKAGANKVLLTPDRSFLDSLRPGMAVRRLLGGVVPMMLRVSSADATHIRCGDYLFLRETGCEVDEDLGWDGINDTGSFLVPPES